MSGKSVGDNKNNTKDAPKSDEEKFEVDKKLCGLVEKHPQLYNTDHREYLRRDITSATWKAIAASCSDTADNCKTRWQKIRSQYKRWLEKGNKAGKPFKLAKYVEFVRPYLNNADRQTAVGVANEVEIEKTDVKNVVGDNKDLPQLTGGMQKMKLDQKSETPKKTIQKGGTSAVDVANKVKIETIVVKNVVTVNKDLPQLTAGMSETPKKNIQKPKTTTPKGATSAVGVANKESETPKKNIQKPKTTTPKGATSTVGVANKESETPKKNIQKPKTTTPKGGTTVYNITINNTP
ncbi:uncharacterized protein LOC105209827 [Zeugodacus cucurbitae]|uniref:uncharacterized protein LOC105209827 n=1 Tax=Zeugodacus cucurbitae TaxID=28588 RepID=UPI0023D9206F|nr:uncharacterized protein LOC105209827 [Zeugodacus cucurbitae]